MALVRWNPWVGLFGLQRDFDLLARRLLGDGPVSSGLAEGGTWTPRWTVFHRGDDLVVRAEVPGIDPEKDVEIALHDGMLTIRGERRHEERSSTNGGERFESATGSFSRSVALPEGVTEEDIQARYEDGILEVLVPGAARPSEARRIPIEVGGCGRTLTARGRKS
jgi:HSP20 family protein